MEIQYRLNNRTKEARVPLNSVPFGKERSKHMFVMDYDGKNWLNPRIIKYDDMELKPGAQVLHYSNEIFEGCKAYMHQDGELYTFRLDENAKRFNQSAKIMRMPTLPEEYFIEACHALIDVDRNDYPLQEGACLYVRPFMIGVDDSLGVKPGVTHQFRVMLSPSGAYFSGGFNSLTMLLQDHFKRATPHGTGTAKTGGNYAASLRPGEIAKKLGAGQVLYTDINNETIEEFGAMNFYMVKDGEIIIPEFTDTILKSITARSMLELGDYIGVPVKQARITVDELVEGILNGSITETGGLGTAAVVAPVGRYIKLEAIDDPELVERMENDVESVTAEELNPYTRELVVGDEKVGRITQLMYDGLTGIQWGKIKGPEGWLQHVKRRYTEPLFPENLLIKIGLMDNIQ